MASIRMEVLTKLPLLPLLLLVLLTCGAVRASSLPLDMDMVKGGFGSVAATLAPLYLPVSVSPSSPCGRALQDMAASLATNSSWWAANMVDSWGKTLDGTGMFNGNYYGMFDECVHTAAGDVTGKYCKITTYSMAAERKPGVPEARPWRPDAPWATEVLNRHTRSAATTVPDSTVGFGTCMPSVCTKQELQDSLYKVLLPQGVYPVVNSCSVLNSPVIFTTPDIGFTALLTFLVVLVVCASLVDMCLAHTGNRRLAKGALRYLLVFSAYTNLGKILQVNPSSPPGTISCLHGMRVLSMTWVIYCHQTTVPLVYMANISSYFTAFRGFVAQVILNGYPSVDTFFFLSGLLVAYSVLRTAKKTGGRFNVPLFFIHRIIRLVPPIGIVVGLVATVLRFLVSGPVNDAWNYWYDACQKNWWKDVIFVSNLLQESGDCIGQAWYLGVDMQLYLVAPIIIFPLYRYKSTGEAWLFLLTVVSAIIPAAITYKFDLSPTLLQGQGDNTDAFLKRYMVPWCRASPWLAGVWLGYYLYRQGNARYKMKPLVVVAGWSLASVTGVLVVFGMYSYNQVIGALPYDVVTQIVYSGLHRLAWGAALGWMVFACHNGYGGVVNDFLSHPVWQPFSRLTYTTYLVAVPLQYLIIDNLKHPYYFTQLNTIFSTLGAIFFSVIAAACVSLVAESPVLGLEKLLLTPGGGATNKTPNKGARDVHGASASPQAGHANAQADTALTQPSPWTSARQDDSVVFTVGQDVLGRKEPGKEEALDLNGARSITSL